jgi:hypothetical protein
VSQNKVYKTLYDYRSPSLELSTSSNCNVEFLCTVTFRSYRRNDAEHSPANGKAVLLSFASGNHFTATSDHISSDCLNSVVPTRSKKGSHSLPISIYKCTFVLQNKLHTPRYNGAFSVHRLSVCSFLLIKS